MSGRTKRLACGVVALNVAFLASSVGLAAASGWGETGWGESDLGIVVPVWLVVGSMLILRRPDNAIGWVLSFGVLCWLVSGALGRYAVYGFWHAEAGLPGVHVAFWLSTVTWVPGYTLVLPLVALWFPDGRPPSPRWRPVGWALMLGTTLLMVQYTMFSWVDNGEFPALPAGVENPLHSPALEPFLEVLLVAGAALVLPALFASVASLIVRFRRSRGVERQQLKWVTYAVTIGVTLFTSGNLLTRLPFISWAALGAITGTLFPIAIAVAVLRYRLYDIDRLIRRTVTYAGVTLLLVGLYAAGVVGLGAVLRGVTGGAGGDIVVAASTLLVAAAFGPVRRRVRSAVDRRFNRQRYDTFREVKRFGMRLRDEVDPDAIAQELVATASLTLQPGRASLWLASTPQADR